jgi:hypothetical protein
MATGETSDYTHQAVHHQAGALLKAATGGTDKFWSTAASAAATFFEDTPEEAVKRHVGALRRKFHQGRHLLIKYLPRDVTEQVGERFESLCFWSYVCVFIFCLEGGGFLFCEG